jgi:hypothetical protein
MALPQDTRKAVPFRLKSVERREIDTRWIRYENTSVTFIE